MDVNTERIVWIDASTYDECVRQLANDGFRVFEFHGDGTAEELFRQFRERLPLDPPISGQVNWNALVDSLWTGIDSLAESSIALVWRDAWHLLQKDEPQFALAVGVFSEIAADLAVGAYGAREKKHLRVILVQRMLRSTATKMPTAASASASAASRPKRKSTTRSTRS